ncbi:DUF2894 domain-containing protein [Zhongshania aliphaticivorans]|uniref:DUF2894 domain-containing protein n=1 Tax=Zhongshania aliphaticivorans TaxID=1470434 RepID=UPI0039C9D968
MNSDALIHKISELRTAGADQFDPVRFRYIEALALRAHGSRQPLGQQLTEKSAASLADYLASRGANRADNKAIKSRPGTATVASLAALRRALDASQTRPTVGASDFEQQLQDQEGELLQGALFASSLGNEAAAEPSSDNVDVAVKPLKSSQSLRVHQQRRAAEKRVELAIAEGPESPGPLNPQMLAIKALSIMRDISPHYLNRYVAYLDTLFWVEQLDTAASTKADKKNSRVGSRAKAKKKSV